MNSIYPNLRCLEDRRAAKLTRARLKQRNVGSLASIVPSSLACLPLFHLGTTASTCTWSCSIGARTLLRRQHRPPPTHHKRSASAPSISTFPYTTTPSERRTAGGIPKLQTLKSQK